MRFKHNRDTKWRRRFAWFPVRLNYSMTWVWLEPIWVRYSWNGHADKFTHYAIGVPELDGFDLEKP